MPFLATNRRLRFYIISSLPNGIDFSRKRIIGSFPFPDVTAVPRHDWLPGSSTVEKKKKQETKKKEKRACGHGRHMRPFSRTRISSVLDTCGARPKVRFWEHSHGPAFSMDLLSVAVYSHQRERTCAVRSPTTEKRRSRRESSQVAVQLCVPYPSREKRSVS